MGEHPTFDPKLNCAGEFYFNSLAGNKYENNYGDNLKKFKDIRNSPFVLSSKKINEGVAVVLQACLDNFPAAMNEVTSDELLARSSFADIRQLIQKEIGNFKTVAKDHIGSHTGKIPNPSVSGPGGLLYDKEIFAKASELSFVSSASINAGQRIGAAGNAAQNRAQRFLCVTFKIDGQAVSVFEDISKKGVIYGALLELGFPADDLNEISEIISNRFSSSNTEAPGQYSKGLLWPTEDGDIVITPVHAYAMALEMSSRFKTRVAAGHNLKNTWIKIGGTKPQNAGLVNNDMGGVHRLLKSAPPKALSKSARMTFKIGATKTLPFTTIGPSHPVMKSLIATIADPRLNNILEQRQEMAIKRLVRIVLQPWFEYYALVKEGDQQALRSLDNLHPTQRLLLDGKFSEVKPDDAAEMLKNVTDHVLGLKHGMSGDRYRDQVKSAAIEIFKNKF